MGAIYLDGAHGYPSLLEVCQRAVPGATGWAGWTTRSRGSGGYSAAPMAVIVHHTASPPRSTPGEQFANDARYCVGPDTGGNPDGPVANLVLGPEGQISVHAAGASNHAGDGGPWTTSRGVVPASGMNSRSIGIEASNDGQGQVWSPAQCDAYVALVRELAGAYGFRLDGWGPTSADVVAHMEWAGPYPPTPGRKCDPAGPSPWSGPSGGCNARNYWDMDAFRESLQTGEVMATTIAQLIQPSVDGHPEASKWFVRWASGHLTWATNADTMLAERQGIAGDAIAMGLDQYANLEAQADR